MIDVEKFIAVTSSNIDAIAFDEENSDLYISFLNKKTGSSTLYKYANVTQEVFEELRDADSKGKFIHSRIKGRYEYNKVELEETSS